MTQAEKYVSVVYPGEQIYAEELGRECGEHVVAVEAVVDDSEPVVGSRQGPCKVRCCALPSLTASTQKLLVVVLGTKHFAIR